MVGGAGFLGSALVDRLLAEGHGVDVIDDLSSGSLANLADARADRANDFTFHRLDVNDPHLGDLLDRRRPDVLFHLALPGDGIVVEVDQLTAQFSALLGAARRASVGKVVVALEAGHLYGIVDPSDQPVPESHHGRDHSVAGLASRAVVDALSDARAQHDLDFTALAFGAVYGPRLPAGSLVGSLVRSARAVADRGGEVDDGTLPPVEVVVPAGPGVDLVFVDDAVDALDRAAAGGGGLVINIGTGTAIDRAELALAVVRAEWRRRGLSGQPTGDHWALVTTGVEERQRPGRGLALDSERARAQLGWSWWTGLEAGLESLLGT